MVSGAALLAALVCTPPVGAPPAPAAPSAQAPAAFSTISGRPPEPPLKRVEPRIWEAQLNASVYAPVMRDGQVQTMALSRIMVWMPVVLQSTWSQVSPDSIRTEIWVQGEKAPDAKLRTTTRQGLAQGMMAVGIAIPDANGQSIKWTAAWTEQCWSSVVDERAAAAITWPAEWPTEAQESLKPSPGIESGHEDFRKFVDRASGGNLRTVTPWIAAKELVRATIQAFSAVDADGTRIENGFPRGIVFNGAWNAMNAGTGSCHDVAAACVAVLRAAGIPARVVLGMAEQSNSAGTSQRTRFISWCEFYLPTAGWVPFSPNDLRGSIRGGITVDRPWKNFGTWDDLNRCLPICYGFASPVPGAVTMPYPAGYAWTANGVIDLSRSSDVVTLQITSRGRAKE